MRTTEPGSTVPAVPIVPARRGGTGGRRVRTSFGSRSVARTGVSEGLRAPVRSSDVAAGDRDDTCLLCRAERLTPWYHEDDVCWVADCTLCATPMVVWRWHGTEPSATDRDHMLARLGAAAELVFDGHYLDGNMRNIPDHFHMHARPEGGFFGHGFRRPGSAAGAGDAGGSAT